MKIGVQLYTLRSLMEKDLWGTLTRLAEAGFKNVELAGLYGKSAEEWREQLAKMGLQAVSTHTGVDQVENDLGEVVQTAHTLGYKFVICPWVPEAAYASGWNVLGKRLDVAGAKLQEHELQFGYHNHSFEFAKVGDRTGLQTLFDNSSGVNVVAEIDAYWVQHGQASPAKYIQDLAGRIPLVHYKDMATEGHFTEVGSGILDWDDIIESSRASGVEYAVIENDDPKIDPLESVVKSRKFLLEKGLSD
jgi:sugar phosphate isomerase/epimerase